MFLPTGGSFSSVHFLGKAAPAMHGGWLGMKWNTLWMARQKCVSVHHQLLPGVPRGFLPNTKKWKFESDHHGWHRIGERDENKGESNFFLPDGTPKVMDRFLSRSREKTRMRASHARKVPWHVRLLHVFLVGNLIKPFGVKTRRSGLISSLWLDYIDTSLQGMLSWHETLDK